MKWFVLCCICIVMLGCSSQPSLRKQIRQETRYIKWLEKNDPEYLEYYVDSVIQTF